MNRYYFSCILLLFLSVLCIQAQGYDKNCFYGITFEVSENPNWGQGELVITAVEPYSAADKAGVKVDDIIMEINGKATYLRDNETIANLLFGDMYNPTSNFTIRNLTNSFTEYPLTRQCISNRAVSEKDLSKLFSFYSLENTNQQKFALPLQLDPNKNVDFADYHTYDFYKEKNISQLDLNILAILEGELNAKGLERNTLNPDIIIQPYYNYGINAQYDPKENNPSYAPISRRYDSATEQMMEFPILNTKEPNMERKAQYVAEFGISFFDTKYLNPGKLTQIWDCSLKDYLVSEYSFESYVRTHAPLMLMQYPYSTGKIGAEYTVAVNSYYYTGIYYDVDDLATVRDIDTNSPAYAAGIRSGYVIKKINNKAFDHTKDILSDGYKNFITETMAYRDQTTRFESINGYPDCMFWDKNLYPEIIKQFNKEEYHTSFAYLYGFAKYVNKKDPTPLIFEVYDGKYVRTFQVSPTIHHSVVVKALK